MIHPLQIWYWLTDPSPTIQQPELRRRSRLLMSILIILCFLLIFVLALIPVQLKLFTDPTQRNMLTVTFPLILAPAAVPLAIAYILSRRGQYKTPALIVTITTLVLAFANLLATRDPTELSFPIVAVIISSILLSRRVTLAFFAATLAGILLLPLIITSVSLWEVTGAFILMLAMGVLSSVAATIHDRDLIQIEHQARSLEENREKVLGAKKMEAVARLSAGIAHEFNNILMAIIGYSEVIAKKPAGSVQQYAYLIKDAGLRASQLTERLLSFSQQQLLRPQEINLNLLIKELEHLLRSMLSDRTTLTVLIDPESKVVYVDPDLIGQAVRTLVVKAENNIRSGGKITIETKNVLIPQEGSELSLNPGSYCSVIISDTGPVIDKEVLTRIFEPFFTTGEFGTGDLDLAAAYGVVRQSSGQIEVNSDPKRGNSYTILLPQHEHTL